MAEVKVSSATSSVTSIGISTREMMTPAMASPRGCLNSPMNENTAPNIHISHPRKGNQPTNMLISARMNPAVPMPFDRFSFPVYGCQGSRQ